jgi:hypothetical protein
MRSFRQSSAPVDEENPYWVSFSDVMAALVVIFILASLVLLGNRKIWLISRYCGEVAIPHLNGFIG